MQFTIVADKLAGLSVDDFKYEFCKVHANETKEAASSLGLISQYIQGLYIPSAFEDTMQLSSLPLSEHDGPYQSLAQLTWPSVTVLQGSLQSAEYRASPAAKHKFATPQHIFLTERLESDTHAQGPSLGRPSQIAKGHQRPVVLIAALTPEPGLNEIEFKERWAKHGDRTRALGMAYYQRNSVISVPREQLYATFAETQFSAEKYWDRGGYEQFVFASIEQAQSFCNEHGQALRTSYEGFCDMQLSWCAGFDYVEHWGREDIGLKQRALGSILGAVLGAKTSFGF